MTKFGPYPPAPSTARFELHTQVTGGPLCLTRFFMKYSLALSAPDATTLATTLATSWNTRFAPIVSTSYSLVGVNVNDLGSRTGVETTLTVAHAGTDANPGISASAAFVMSAHVSLKYRGGHSRVYIPGLNNSLLSDQNTWSVAAQGQVFTAWTGMLSDLANSPPVAVGTLTQVTVRYISSNKADFPSGSEPPTFPALLPTPMVLGINSWSSNQQLGSQRRRNQQ